MIALQVMGTSFGFHLPPSICRCESEMLLAELQIGTSPSAIEYEFIITLNIAFCYQ